MWVYCACVCVCPVCLHTPVPRRAWFEEQQGRAKAREEEEEQRRRRARDKFSSFLRHAKGVSVSSTWDAFIEQHGNEREVKDVSESPCTDCVYSKDCHLAKEAACVSSFRALLPWAAILALLLRSPCTIAKACAPRLSSMRCAYMPGPMSLQVDSETAHTLFDEYIAKLRERAAEKAARKRDDSDSGEDRTGGDRHKRSKKSKSSRK